MIPNFTSSLEKVMVNRSLRRSSSSSTISAVPKKKVVDKKWKAPIFTFDSQVVDPDAVPALRIAVNTDRLLS